MNKNKLYKNKAMKLGSPERFGYAWSIANKISPINEKQFLNWTKVIKDKKFWQNKIILDVGCGIGRNTYWPITYGAKTAIAFDLDDRTVEVARKNLSKFDNVIVEKKNAYSIGYVNKFDVCFSIGVIHHLANPIEAINQMIKALKPNGTIIIWVYGYENMWLYVKFLNPIRKILFSRAPIRLVRIISFLPSLIFYILIKFRILTKIEYFKFLRKLKFIEIQQIVFDQMLPKTAKYFTKEEALNLLNHKKLSNLEIEWVNDCSWSIKAIKI